jgi:hypothetical protein
MIRIPKNVPAIINALSEMVDGFDVSVTMLQNNQVAITRPGFPTVIVTAYGWDMSLSAPGAIRGLDRFAKQQVEHIVRTLCIPPGSASFGDSQVLDSILEKMQNFVVVAPTAVAVRVAKKFPLNTQFVQVCLNTWLSDSPSKFTAFFNP